MARHRAKRDSGWRVIRDSLGGLMDKAAPEEQLAQIRDVISQEADGALEVVFVARGAPAAALEHQAALAQAVYRLRDLTPDDRPDAQMWPGPMVRFALFITYGQPFDTEFMLGDGKFYNAELAYQSALNAGIAPGKPRSSSS